MAGLISAATALAEQPLLSMSATSPGPGTTPGNGWDRHGALGFQPFARPRAPDRHPGRRRRRHGVDRPRGRDPERTAGQGGGAVGPPARQLPAPVLPAPHARLDQRRARRAGGRLADPHSGAPPSCRVWARWPTAGSGPMDASVLALLSDHIPFAPRLLLGDRVVGTTLDATLRILPGIDTVATDAWVLLDVTSTCSATSPTAPSGSGRRRARRRRDRPGDRPPRHRHPDAAPPHDLSRLRGRAGNGPGGRGTAGPTVGQKSQREMDSTTQAACRSPQLHGVAADHLDAAGHLGHLEDLEAEAPREPTRTGDRKRTRFTP